MFVAAIERNRNQHGLCRQKLCHTLGRRTIRQATAVFERARTLGLMGDGDVCASKGAKFANP